MPQMRDVRLSPMKEGVDDLQKLVFGDGATSQLEVDVDVVRDRCGSRQRLDVLGLRIDDGQEFVDVLPVAQGLNPPCGGARPDGHHCLRHLSYAHDPLRVVRRGDGALHQREVIRPIDLAAGGLGEIGDLDGAGNLQEVVLGVEESQLATVARGEFPHGESRFERAHSSGTRRRSATCAYGSTGPSRQRKSGPN